MIYLLDSIVIGQTTKKNYPETLMKTILEKFMLKFYQKMFQNWQSINKMLDIDEYTD